MKILIKNIKELLQVREEPLAFVAGGDMKTLPTIRHAYLMIESGRIMGFGKMENCPDGASAKMVDATGKVVLPTWCDPHTHIVYAGDRAHEFVQRIKGKSYQEISKEGGGILHSAHLLQATSAEDLYSQSATRLDEVISLGTGAIEIKSGYGLTAEAELKMLRVIKELQNNYPIPIQATFLAAHALPIAYQSDRSSYVQSMITKVLPTVARENLASFIDVFCETGYFTVDDLEIILEAGKKFNLRPKVHVNQFSTIGGIEAAVKHQALSVDHLEVMRSEDVKSLLNTSTMPTALPGCSFFLGIPYTPARAMIDAGLPLALASDYNPGSAPSGNMNFVVSSACIKLSITPNEAINAATLNAAYAMGLEKEVGSITIGKRANLIITKPIVSYASLPYAFGSNLIDQVLINGAMIN